MLTRGSILTTSGNAKEAIESYEQALEFAGNQRQSLLRIGCSISALQKIMNSPLETYKTPVEFNGNHQGAVQLFAWSYRSAGGSFMLQNSWRRSVFRVSVVEFGHCHSKSSGGVTEALETRLRHSHWRHVCFRILQHQYAYMEPGQDSQKMLDSLKRPLNWKARVQRSVLLDRCFAYENLEQYDPSD